MAIKRGKYKKPVAKKKIAEAKKTTVKDIEQDKKINKLIKLTKHLRPEIKYFDAGNSTTGEYRFYFRGEYIYNGNKWGTLSNFDLIPQGTGSHQRVGTVINPKSFELNLELTKGTGTQNKYRIIVMQMTDYIGGDTDAIWRALEYGTYGTGGGASSALLSPYNKQPLTGYVVHYDKVYTINDQKPGANHRIKVKNLRRIEYSDSGTQPIRGQIVALLIDNSPDSSGSSTPSGYHIAYYFTSRLKYYDN